MVKKLSFKQVDVFSAFPFKGNPVCVFLDSTGLSSNQMQEIARWTNLSETTFISPSDKADYCIRIFTPQEELPFAGHPTIGSAHALLEANNINKSSIIQECAYGFIKINIVNKRIYFTLPRYTILHEVDYKLIVKSLGVNVSKDSRVIDTGPHWIITNLESSTNLSHISLNHKALLALLSQYKATGITLYTAAYHQVNVRTFFAANGVIVEDPICGSGNAAVAAHIKETGRMRITGSEYQAQQGQFIGRDGTVFVRISDNISVGGQCRTIFDGKVMLQI